MPATRRLSRQLNLVTALALPEWSAGPTGRFETWPEAIAAAGYEGVQTFDARSAAMFHAAGLTTSGIGRADTPEAVDELVGTVEDWGGTAVSLHLGSGFEDEVEARRLVEHAAERAASSALSVVVETHRATLFQDPYRAVVLARDHPELRFCADLSHWYTGSEMTYGDLDAKLAFVEPFLRRCHMVHARISDPGCIEVRVEEDDDRPFVLHFAQMWRTVCDGYLADEGAPDALPVMPELLPAVAHYRRTVPGPDGPQEDGDRWTQGLLLCDLLDAVFEEAVAALG